MKSDRNAAATQNTPPNGERVGKCDFIRPPDFLKGKVVKGEGWDLESIQMRADKALERLHDEYLAQAKQDLGELEAAMGLAKSCDHDEREEHLRRVHRLAHDMRGQAGTFGYPLITTIGTSLCDYIEEVKSLDSIQLAAIEIHADAMRAVIAGDIQGDGGSTGQKVLAGMQALVSKTLKA